MTPAQAGVFIDKNKIARLAEEKALKLPSV